MILSAAQALLSEVGCGSITIEAVAARAGVGKSTIYRHWPGKIELIEDAICSLREEVAVPVGGSARDRLVGFLQGLARNMADSTWSACLPAIIDAAERDAEVLALQRRLSLERRQALVDLLAEGVRAGEIGPSVDLGLLAECLVGPMLVRRLLLHEPFDPAAVPVLVDQVLGRPGRAGAC